MSFDVRGAIIENVEYLVQDIDDWREKEWLYRAIASHVEQMLRREVPRISYAEIMEVIRDYAGRV